MQGTLSSENISTKLARIAELARKHPERSFSSLHQVIDLAWLREAAGRVRKDAAAGVDGQTWSDYAPDETTLERNLEALQGSFKAGTYRAPPVRRVHIPKGDGRTRPIGLPTVEDKILQRAVAMVLEAIYEQSFKDCSYGFRPGRSAHDALESLWDGLMNLDGGFVVDADIKGFFDNLDHGHLRSFLSRRVTDGVLRRTIDKWLKAGVMEAGAVTHPETGTPQGGVISPLLANVYLHEVLDEWFERDVLPRLSGRAQLVRYADDFVIICGREDDARRLMDVLPKRFGKYGLELHPDKTRLVHFERPRHRPGDTRRKDDRAPPETFDLLGFTHRWGVSRQRRWYVERRTATGRFTRALERIRAWCRAHRHDAVPDQHRALVQKLRGHYGYYGITGNSLGLSRFRYEVAKTWRKWLDRRSEHARMTWEKFLRLLERYPLPPPRMTRRPPYRSANP
jgi:group II intron reverse transcriptase/maturase